MQEVNMIGKKKNVSTLAFSETDKGAYATVSMNGQRVTTYAASGIRGNVVKSSGKWYFEFKIIQTEATGATKTGPLLGIGTKQTSLSSPWAAGIQMLAWYCEGVSGSNLIFGISQPRPTYGAPVSANDNVGVALDMDTRKMQFYRNGVAQGVLNLDTYTDGTQFYPYVCSPYGGGATIVDLLSGTNLVYPIPSGYQAW